MGRSSPAVMMLSGFRVSKPYCEAGQRGTCTLQCREKASHPDTCREGCHSLHTTTQQCVQETFKTLYLTRGSEKKCVLCVCRYMEMALKYQAYFVAKKRKKCNLGILLTQNTVSMNFSRPCKGMNMKFQFLFFASKLIC